MLQFTTSGVVSGSELYILGALYRSSKKFPAVKKKKSGKTHKKGTEIRKFLRKTSF